MKEWLREFKEVVDKRVLWDLLKYKIRQLTINYSKTKARNRRAKESKLEKKSRDCTEKCDTASNNAKYRIWKNWNVQRLSMTNSTIM